jgi:hypothetical protein
MQDPLSGTKSGPKPPSPCNREFVRRFPTKFLRYRKYRILYVYLICSQNNIGLPRISSMQYCLGKAGLYIFILALSTKDTGLWYMFVWNIAIRLLESTFAEGRPSGGLLPLERTYQRPRSAVPTEDLGKICDTGGWEWYGLSSSKKG